MTNARLGAGSRKQESSGQKICAGQNLNIHWRTGKPLTAETWASEIVPIIDSAVGDQKQYGHKPMNEFCQRAIAYGCVS